MEFLLLILGFILLSVIETILEGMLHMVCPATILNAIDRKSSTLLLSQG